MFIIRRILKKPVKYFHLFIIITRKIKLKLGLP